MPFYLRKPAEPMPPPIQEPPSPMENPDAPVRGPDLQEPEEIGSGAKLRPYRERRWNHPWFAGVTSLRRLGFCLFTLVPALTCGVKECHR